MRASGKVNLIGLVIIAAVIGGIWWVVNYSGVYLDNMDVKDAVKSGFNSWGMKNEENIRGMILQKVNDKHLGWHRETDEFGEETVTGGLGINEEQVVIEADEVARELTIRVEYDREVALKPIGGRKNVHFVVEVSGPYPR